MSRSLGRMLVTLFLFALVGCGPKPMNIRITLDKSFLDANPGVRPIQVNVTALRNPEAGVLAKAPMTEYWGKPAPKPAHAEVFQLDARTPEKVILVSDPMWKEWIPDGADEKNPPQVFVLVQLPGTWDASKDRDGSLDPRRRIFSTVEKHPNESVHVVIGKDSIWVE